MEENIIDFPGETTLPIPVNKVLDGAKLAELDYVVVLGWDEGGELYMASSTSDPAESVFIMEKAKHWLLSEE